MDVAERLAGPSARGYSLHALSVAHALRGEWSEAIAAIESALAVARERHVCREWEVYMLAPLARACRGAGDLQRALAAAREAVALSDARGVSPWAPIAHLELARALRAAAGAAAAGDIAHHLDRAMSFVQQTGARVFAPPIVEERARLAEICGDTAAASKELQRAHALYVEIGATGHAERLARELGA